MVSQLFINLPVKDLQRSISFFTALGFTFNPQFTDENATCMILGESFYAMLLTEPFFKGFTPKEICDTSKSTEVLIALSLNSKEEVNNMVTTAVENGGKEYRDTDDRGFMYTRCFADPDGHQWELAWMDMSAFPQE